MGERFERFKSRVNNQPEIPFQDECDIQVLLEDWHEMLHEMLEISQEEMTNERWTEIVDAAGETVENFPDFTNGEIGIMLYMILKQFKNAIEEDAEITSHTEMDTPDPTTH